MPDKPIERGGAPLEGSPEKQKEALTPVQKLRITGVKPFEKNKDIETQIGDTLRLACIESYGQEKGEKFFKALDAKAILDSVKNNKAEYAKLEKNLKKVRSILIQPNSVGGGKETRLIFLSEDKNFLAVFELGGSLLETTQRAKAEEQKAVIDAAALQRNLEIGLAPRKADTQAELAANDRMSRIQGDRKAQRKEILAQKSYRYRADLDANIAVDDPDAFAKQWPALEGSHDIENLFDQTANPEAGYSVNPFKSHNWNPEKLRDLITEGVGAANRQIYFIEVGNKLLKDEFDGLKNDLAKAGMKADVLKEIDQDFKWLDPDMGSDTTDDLGRLYTKTRAISDTLQNARIPNNLPDNYFRLWIKRDQVKILADVLGDYVAYSQRMVYLVDKLKYNSEADKKVKGALNIYEKDGRVADALRTLYIDGQENAKSYESEWSHFWGSDGRELTFRDMNGESVTVKGDWASNYQSPKVGYRQAYERAEVIEKDAQGRSQPMLRDSLATQDINTNIDLGVRFFDVAKDEKDETLKQVLDDLGDAGVELRPGVRLKGSDNKKQNVENLIAALSIKSVEDINATNKVAKRDAVVAFWESDTPEQRAEALNKARARFVRIGSAVRQHRNAKQEAAAHEKRLEERESKSVAVKFSPSQAETIVTRLRKEHPDITEEQAVKMKTSLVGGAIFVIGRKGINGGAGGFAHFQPEGLPFGIDVGLGFNNYDLDRPMAAVGIGGAFKASENITVGLGGGVMHDFSPKSEGGGTSIGTGFNVTFHNDDGPDVFIEGSVGYNLTQGIPGGSLGVGARFYDVQKKYKEEFTAIKAKNHIEELDKSGDPHRAVLENPEKYPEWADMLVKMRATKLGALKGASEKTLFNSYYDLKKQELQSQAVDNSGPAWYERITSASVGIAMVGPIPFIYIKLGIDVGGRTLVHRLATSNEKVQDIGDSDVRAQLEKQLRSNSISVGAQTLSSSGEIMLDPETNQLKVLNTSESSFDMTKLNRFNRVEELQNTLLKKSNIEATPMSDGRLLLRPFKAHGNVRVIVDPALGDKAVISGEGRDLFVSLKDGTPLCVTRTDQSYPFDERNESEMTTIVISDHPSVDRNLIMASSGYMLERSQDGAWAKRQINLDQKGVAQQDNVKNGPEFAVWAQGRTDRMKLESQKEYAREWNAASARLEGALEITSKAGAGLEVRKSVQDVTDALVKEVNLKSKSSFKTIFRKVTREAFDFGKIKAANADWKLDFPAIAKLLTTEFSKRGIKDLTPNELNSACTQIMIGTFVDRTPKDLARYEKYLETFHRPILKSYLVEYFAGQEFPDKQKKIDAMADWMIQNLKGVDTTQAGATVAKDTYFATTLGTMRMPGRGNLYNYTETNPKYGVIGYKPMDVRAEGIPGDVAKFWTRTLSPFKEGLGAQQLPAEGTKEREAYERDLYKNLNSPLVLKLVSLFKPIMKPTELDALAKIYSERTNDQQRVRVTSENSAILEKLMAWSDRVRAAQFSGEKELRFGRNFTLRLDEFTLALGLYKKCGNVSGLMREKFTPGLMNDDLLYAAAYGESTADVKKWEEERRFEVTTLGAVNVKGMPPPPDDTIIVVEPETPTPIAVPARGTGQGAAPAVPAAAAGPGAAPAVPAAPAPTPASPSQSLGGGGA